MTPIVCAARSDDYTPLTQFEFFIWRFFIYFHSLASFRVRTKKKNDENLQREYFMRLLPEEFFSGSRTVWNAAEIYGILF
jgi:hypothetical protein